jgi:hypothetical protein
MINTASKTSLQWVGHRLSFDMLQRGAFVVASSSTSPSSCFTGWYACLSLMTGLACRWEFLEYVRAGQRDVESCMGICRDKVLFVVTKFQVLLSVVSEVSTRSIQMFQAISG